MNATQEVREQYKQAARTYIEHINTKDRFRGIEFYEGRLSGLDVALSCLGVTSDEIREMYAECEEQVKDEKANEDIGPGDVSYDEEGFVTEVHKRLQPELEQQAEQAFTEQEEDIYECEHCNATFPKSAILYREYGGEIGGITFCPRCKEETKLICVSDLVKRDSEREELDAIERPASQTQVEADENGEEQ